jgi:hypothetical protein
MVVALASGTAAGATGKHQIDFEVAELLSATRPIGAAVCVLHVCGRERHRGYVEACEDIMSRQSMEESYLENGEFLPISVWVTRGFNGDKIQAETEPEVRAPRDIKIHKSGRPDR